MSSLKLVSVNIERSKHLALVEPFIREQKPDVLCVQELMEYDIERLSNAMNGAACEYEPMANRPKEEPPGKLGVGIFTKLPMQNVRRDYYVGAPGTLRDNIQSDESTYNNMNRLILSADIENEGKKFRIGTTHFRWTPDGSADEGQRDDMQRLLDMLRGYGEFILCGDFNAPRGGEIFAMLESRYKDNIPLEYKTSIDGNLHRNGPLPHMVDGLFTTSRFIAYDAQLISGVSDHCAIVATVTSV